MSKSFMLVHMPVYLEIEKEHSRKHKQRRHPIFHGWTLSKNDNGKDGADNPLPAGTVPAKVTVQLQGAEVHFPFFGDNAVVQEIIHITSFFVIIVNSQ